MLPATPLRSASDPNRYLGLTIDLETVGAMKAKYPKTMVGVRFHEVYGCDSVWRGDGQTDCFQLAPEIFTGFIDLCAEKGMIFYHNDQTWLMRHDMQGSGQWSYHKTSPAYYLAKLLEHNTSSTVEYARKKLGKRALLSYETNNGAVPAADLAFFTVRPKLSRARARLQVSLADESPFRARQPPPTRPSRFGAGRTGAGPSPSSPCAIRATAGESQISRGPGPNSSIL